MSKQKLCYIEDNWAYFTDRLLEGEGRQWGDDWDDAPYEHNAGIPYDHHGENITVMAWRGPLETPASNCVNSNYSVDRINQGAIPWLVTERWEKDLPFVAIPAGVSQEEFTRLVQSVGGEVYREIRKA